MYVCIYVCTGLLYKMQFILWLFKGTALVRHYIRTRTFTVGKFMVAKKLGKVLNIVHHKNEYMWYIHIMGYTVIIMNKLG